MILTIVLLGLFGIAVWVYGDHRTWKDKYDTQCSNHPLNPPGPRRECDCPDCMEPGLR